MKMNVNLPETHEVSSRGKTVTVDVTKLDAEMIAKLALHGLTQKVADAAAGAKKAAGENATEEEIAETGFQLMDAVAKRLESGDWGAERGTGGTTDPLDPWRIKVLRATMRDGKTENARKMKETHDAIPSADQKARRDYLLSIAEKNREAVDAKARELRDAAKPAIELDM